METGKLKNDMIKLPKRIVNRLKGKLIEIAEVKEGILLKTESHPITEARGFLKGKQFTTKRYLEMKNLEKELE